MRVRNVLTILFFVMAAYGAHGQATNADLTGMLGDKIGTGLTTVDAEWNNVSAQDRACLDAKLRENGSSLQNWMRRGVIPSHPTLAYQLAGCRTALQRQGPSQTATSRRDAVITSDSAKESKFPPAAEGNSTPARNSPHTELEKRAEESGSGRRQGSEQAHEHFIIYGGNDIGMIPTSSEMCTLLQHPLFAQTELFSPNNPAGLDPGGLSRRWLSDYFRRHRAPGGFLPTAETAAKVNNELTKCLRSLDAKRLRSAAFLLFFPSMEKLQCLSRQAPRLEKSIRADGTIVEKSIETSRPCVEQDDFKTSLDGGYGNWLKMLVLKDAHSAFLSILDDAKKQLDRTQTSDEFNIQEALRPVRLGTIPTGREICEVLGHPFFSDAETVKAARGLFDFGDIIDDRFDRNRLRRGWLITFLQQSRGGTYFNGRHFQLTTETARKLDAVLNDCLRSLDEEHRAVFGYIGQCLANPGAPAGCANGLQNIWLMMLLLKEGHPTIRSILDDAANVISQQRENETAEDRKATAEADQKGLEFARASGTTWKRFKKRNEMTDKDEVGLTSIQENGEGARAEITGSCGSRGPVFTALLVDTNGKPLTLPGYNAPREYRTGNASLDDIASLRNNTVSGSRRVNSEPEDDALFPTEQFRNRFVFASFSKKPSASLLTVLPEVRSGTTWRVLAKVVTSRGDMTLKLPTYNENVRNFIASCMPN